jgi:hypothetical protein
MPIESGNGIGKNPTDRNTFNVGPSRVDVDKELPRVNQKAETSYSKAETVVSEGGGGAELFNGEVQTYIESTKTGTVLTSSGSNPFYNATGFGLFAGDVVTLCYATGIPDPIAVGIFSNFGGYVPIVTTSPQANNNFPYDGDQLTHPHNYPLGLGSQYGNVLFLPAAMGFAWYGTGALGYSGRIVAMPARTSGDAAPGVAVYDVETGSVTLISRSAPVAGAVLQGIGVMGNYLFLTWGFNTWPTTTNLVERYDSSTGVWTTYNIQSPIFLGVSSNRAWFLGVTSGSTTWKIYSIDSTGTLSSINNPQGYTHGGATGSSAIAAFNAFGRAKNGRLYIAFQLSGASQMSTATTGVDAASLSFTSNASPNNFLWSSYGSAIASHGVTRLGSTNAVGSSDIDTSGDLVYAFRGGSPTTWGFARVNRITLAVTSYSQITSSTGNQADGELMFFGGLTSLGNSEVVMFGAIREDVVVSGGRTNQTAPAHWRTDGTTTAAIYDTSYSANTLVAPLTRTVQRNTTEKTYVYLTNISSTTVGTTNVINPANPTGPATVNALTAP